MPSYDVREASQHQEDNMNSFHIRRSPRLRSGFIVALLCLAGPAVWAQSAKPGNVTGGAPASAAEPRPPTSVRFIKAPSDETPAARARRLKRECKGKPNAGMCLGHAS